MAQGEKIGTEKVCKDSKFERIKSSMQATYS